jgi:hypothetical protein
MRAPVISASLSKAWSFFGIRSHASCRRRCSSADRIRVRRFCSRKRFTPLAGESTRYVHSTASDRIDFSVSSSRFTVPGFTGFADFFCLNALLDQLRTQAEVLARSGELERMLEREETWLVEARRTVVEVRHWLEREAQRFWFGAVRRWLVAAVFAIASAAAAGAGYAWASKPFAVELDALRNRHEFLDYIERRIVAMTPAERRQFDALMRLNSGAER